MPLRQLLQEDAPAVLDLTVHSKHCCLYWLPQPVLC
jgi:hypothetical protein